MSPGGRGLHLDIVRRWRGRFAEQGLPGLKDRQRRGRPPVFTPLQVAEVKALACRLPAERGVPLSLWSCPELAYEASRRGIAAFESASTVRRRLADDALKPWQHLSWIFITDPDLRAKAQRVLDLTCTRAPGRAPRWTPTSTSSSPTKRPPSRPAAAAAAAPPSPRARPAR
ncbi:helix-turn-helix domain-containing protein [Streptomyces sp. 900116325]